MNIIWLSANKFGFELFKEAKKIKNVKFKGIVTLSNNAQIKMYDGIENKKWKRFGIRMFEITDINKEKRLIEKLSPDLMIVCGWRQKISKNIISIPKKRVIGFHPTLLPYGRGPAPIINSILEGVRLSGVSMFYLTNRIDEGDIIAQDKFLIDSDDHAMDVYDKAIRSGKKLVRKFLPLVVKGKAPVMVQDKAEAVTFRKRKLKDNRIDLDKETLVQTYNKIRALSKPYEGAYIEKNTKRLIIWRAELR